MHKGLGQTGYPSGLGKTKPIWSSARGVLRGTLRITPHGVTANAGPSGSNKAKSAVPARPGSRLCETKPIPEKLSGGTPNLRGADDAKQSRTWADRGIWGTVRRGVDCTKQTQFEDSLKCEVSGLMWNGCETNPIRRPPGTPPFHYSIIPASQSDTDCAKQTQFPVPGILQYSHHSSIPSFHCSSLCPACETKPIPAPPPYAGRPFRAQRGCSWHIVRDPVHSVSGSNSGWAERICDLRE